jgi:putative nucleotidyltransferase with HDIG domain
MRSQKKIALRAAFLRTIRSLVTALEAKDPYTRGHSVSVKRYAIEMGKEMGKSPSEIETLEKLAVLHDVGKIGVQDAALKKASPLTGQEEVSMQQHPVIGAKILAPLQLPPTEVDLILKHHEREDGSGYPQGIDRTQISDLVAIVSVADAFDAMTSHRPYRPPMKPAEALGELRRCAGSQFRAEVVEALAVVLKKTGRLP